jgi:hypothetical protein
MNGYYPDKSLIFAGVDSIGIEHFYPDGEYQVESINYELVNAKTDYEFRLSGISSLKTYSYNLTFDTSDTLGATKKSVLVHKNGNTYTIK